MIDPTATVHPTAIVEGDVSIGPGTTVGAFCYIQGPVRIGANNRIFPHVVIGTEGDHKTATPQGVVLIGDGNVIRDRTVIHRGTGDRDTEIGNDCYITAGCYIAHDCWVQDGVTLSPGVSLGGHTVIGHGANIGMRASLHQRSTVGAFTMVGMGAVVTKDPPPLSLVMGTPARVKRMNSYMFGKLGIADEEVRLVSDESGEIVAIHYDTPVVEEWMRSFRECVRRKMAVEVVFQGESLSQ